MYSSGERERYDREVEEREGGRCNRGRDEREEKM